MIDNNYVECVIQLPGNLFFGTSIATCIMVLKKNKVENNTFFIDASKECVKVTNNNKLTEENIQKILSVYSKRKDEQYYAAVVSNDKVADNGYNLSVSVYVEQEDTREKIDIRKLNAEIKEIVAREEILQDGNDFQYNVYSNQIEEKDYYEKQPAIATLLKKIIIMLF